MEYWKDIPGFEGHYRASSHGRIYSLKTNKILSGAITHNGYLRVSLHLENKPLHKRVHRLIAKTFNPNVDNKPCVNHIDGNKENNHADNLCWCTNMENSRHAVANGLMNVEPSKYIQSLKLEAHRYKHKYLHVKTELKTLKHKLKGYQKEAKKARIIVEQNHLMKDHPREYTPSKLDKDLVKTILKLSTDSDNSLTDIAKMFNVSRMQIVRICRGECWKDVHREFFGETA